MPALPSRRLTAWDRIVLFTTAVPLLGIILIGPAVGSGAVRLPTDSYCLSVRWFDAECPGCGLTRSLVLLSTGQLADSFRMNPMGIAFTLWLLALFVARPAKIQTMRIGSLARWDIGVTIALLAVAVVRVAAFYVGR